jgi:hypothetical protein
MTQNDGNNIDGTLPETDITMEPMAGAFLDNIGKPAEPINKSGVPLDCDEPLASDSTATAETWTLDNPELPTEEGEDVAFIPISDDIAAHGFVPLHRRYQTKWWWEHQPWSYGQLFMWMLINANFIPRQAEYNGQIIPIPRGAFATSILALHEKSGLARTTVDRFINKMVQAGELKILQCGRNGIVVCICHYDEYTAVRQRTGQRKV